MLAKVPYQLSAGGVVRKAFGARPYRTKLLIEKDPFNARTSLANQRAGIGTTLVALALAVTAVLLVFSVAFVFHYPPIGVKTSTIEPCDLVTSAQEQSVAGTGAYQNVPDLNQSAPPWNYQSIYQHIQEGWNSICQSPAFVTTIKTHDINGAAAGGGFINTSNPDASVAGISIGWWQQTPTNCTSYEESWSIFIVNGTVSAPLTSTGACISDPPPSESA